jgi:plastocyanin
MPSRTMRAGHLLRLIAATGLVAGTLVIGVSPVGAAAPTKITIVADQPAAVPAGHTWGFNDFFPRSLTVHKGQTIQFVIQGFHTATLLPRGLSAAADLRTNGIAAADADDTTLNPGGQTHSQIRIPAILPTSQACGTAKKPCSFTGAAVVSSGAPLGPGGGPFVVTINAPVGTYTLHCRIHPGMTATIRVAPASVPATTPGAVTSSVKHQIAADIKDAYAAEAAGNVLTSSTLPDGHTLWMATAGTASVGNHVAILEFLPKTIPVAPGDLVLWFSRAANEPHTITFPGELHTDQVALCEDATTGTDTPATPTVVPPTGPFDFACGTPPHPADEIEFAPGNGVRTLADTTTVSDSGLIASDAARAAFGLLPTAALTTWTIGVSASAPAGTYTFVCQIHDGMKGTLVVH